MPEIVTVYLAGPMAGYHEENVPAFRAAAAGLRAHGHAVLNPAESFGGQTGLPLATYARYDIACLLQVDAVVLLPQWERSIGARTEVAIAQWLGLPLLEYRAGLPLRQIYPTRVAAPRQETPHR